MAPETLPPPAETNGARAGAHHAGLGFEWVRDVAGFLELGDAWDGLASSAVETIFLTREWLTSWLETMAPDAELHVMTAWSGGRLVAALPLCGGAGDSGRRWRFMGAGSLTPNHLDIIAEPPFAAAAREGFVEMLLEESGAWDVLEFDKLPADTETAGALHAAFVRAGRATARSVSATCPYIELPPTFDEYLATRGRDHRKDLRRKSRRIAERPEGHRFAAVETAAAADEAIEALMRFHQSRYEAMGHPGAFANSDVVRFHRLVVPRLLASGRLRMKTLSVGGRLAAVSYACRAGSDVQLYLTSFDESFSSLGPGLLLQLHSVAESILEGARRFDFLEGTEAYKSAWCTDERENIRLRVFNATPRGLLSRAATGAGRAAILTARRVLPPGLRESVVRWLARRRAARRERATAER